MFIADIFAFAHNKQTLCFTFALRDLTRLSDMLFHTEGCVQAKIQGVLGKNRKAAIQLTIEGDFPLICQRCLKEMNFHLNHVIVLELAKENARIDEEDLFEENYEIFPTLPKVDVAILVEDEIILALPNFARHDFCRSFDYGCSTEQKIAE